MELSLNNLKNWVPGKKTITFSVCTIVVTLSFVTKANHSSFSPFGVRETADLDSSLTVEDDHILYEANSVTPEEIETARKNEDSPALDSLQLRFMDPNPVLEKGDPEAMFEGQGLSFSGGACRRFIDKNGSYGDFGRISKNIFWKMKSLKGRPYSYRIRSSEWKSSLTYVHGGSR